MDKNQSTEITLGHKFQLLREAANQSEAQMAIALNMPLTEYIRYESDIVDADDSIISRVAQLHNISVPELMAISLENTGA